MDRFKLGASYSRRAKLVALLLLLLSSPVFGSKAIAAEVACDGSPIPLGKRSGSAELVSRPPPPEALPIGVEINLQITELSQIDELSSSFRFEGYADFKWCDARFAFDADVEGTDVRRQLGSTIPDTFWNVELRIANGLGATDVTRRLVEIRADGSIRATGLFNSRVNAPFDLKRFPFDRQRLEIQIESFSYNNEVLELMLGAHGVSHSPDLILPDWRIEEVEARIADTLDVRDQTPFSRAVVTLTVVRESGFYIYKLWIPLFLTVALSWSIFWMQEESLAIRIRICATAFLTVVAYQFSVSGSLPKVAYLTIMDRMLVASFALIAIGALQSVPVTKIRSTNVERAQQIDRVCRWLFPSFYALTMLAIAIVS